MPIKTPIDLGSKPKVKSLEDLQNAMIVLRSVTSQSEALHSRRNAKVADLDADLVERDCVAIGEASLPCKVYCDAIEAAIEDYIRSEPSDLEGKRTINFPAGSIELRRNPDKIDAVGGYSKDDLAKRALEKITKEGKDSEFLAQFGLEKFYRLELKPDLSGMKTLIEKKLLSPGELRKAGYRQLAGEDRIKIEVGD